MYSSWLAGQAGSAPPRLHWAQTEGLPCLSGLQLAPSMLPHPGPHLQLLQALQKLLAGAQLHTAISTLFRPWVSRTSSRLVHGLQRRALGKSKRTPEGYSEAREEDKDEKSRSLNLGSMHIVTQVRDRLGSSWA